MLEEIVYETKAVDERIREKYHKLGDKFENKGISRYLVAGACSLSGVIMHLFGFYDERRIIEQIPIVDMSYFVGYVWMTQGNDFARTMLEPFFKPDCEVSDTAFVQQAPLPGIPYCNAVRLPLMAASLIYASKAFTEFYAYIKTSDSGQLKEGVESLLTSAGFFSTASSIYLKDRKPRILAKPPLKERITNWVREKITKLLPEQQPAPENIPVRVLS